MPHADIRIVRHDDPPPWDGLADQREIIHLTEQGWSVVILEGGMESGAPSIALRLDLPDGRSVLAETSLALWSSVTIAARGAFPEAFAGGPLAVE